MAFVITLPMVKESHPDGEQCDSRAEDPNAEESIRCSGALTSIWNGDLGV